MNRLGLPSADGLPAPYQLVVVNHHHMSTTSQPSSSTQPVDCNMTSSRHVQPASSSLTSYYVTSSGQRIVSRYLRDDVTGCKRRVSRPTSRQQQQQQQCHNRQLVSSLEQQATRPTYHNNYNSKEPTVTADYSVSVVVVKQRLSSCLWVGRSIKTRLQQQQPRTTTTENQVQVEQLCKLVEKEKNLVERCEKCCDVITDELVRAMGKSFHPECFTCIVCDACLDAVAFTVNIHSQVHCIPDYIRRYAPKCSSCQLPVVPNNGCSHTKRVVALDRTFHQTCFRCQRCGVLLTGSTCYPLQDIVVCLSCNIQQQQQPATTTITAAASSFSNQQTVNCLVAHHVPLSTFSDDIYQINNIDDVTPRYVDTPYHVDLTVDDDALSCSSYSNSTTCDDVTLCSSEPSFDDVSDVTDMCTTNTDVISCCADDVTQQHCACSVDSGHCSGASDDTMTSSDTDTVDAESSFTNDSLHGSLTDTQTDVSKLAQNNNNNNTDSIVFQLLLKHLNCSDLQRVTDL